MFVLAKHVRAQNPVLFRAEAAVSLGEPASSLRGVQHLVQPRNASNSRLPAAELTTCLTVDAGGLCPREEPGATLSQAGGSELSARGSLCFDSHPAAVAFYLARHPVTSCARREMYRNKCHVPLMGRSTVESLFRSLADILPPCGLRAQKDLNSEPNSTKFLTS